MQDPAKITWMKRSGHGPSAQHLIADEKDGVVATWCGLSKVRDELDEIEAEDANGECKACIRGHRRSLLANPDVGLDELVEVDAITESAAELLAEASLLHTRVTGSGKYGRILKGDAKKAVSALEGD